MKTLLLCGALAALATPAAARTPPVPNSAGYLQTTVSYADLDLSRAEGVDVLLARIRRAARAVCGQASFRDHDGARASRACMEQAMRAAVGKVGAPLVTARYFGAGSPAKLAAR